MPASGQRSICSWGAVAAGHPRDWPARVAALRAAVPFHWIGPRDSGPAGRGAGLKAGVPCPAGRRAGLKIGASAETLVTVRHTGGRTTMRKEGPSRFALLATLLLAAPAAAQPLADANPEDVVHGTRVFEIHCARCHGIDGAGGEGPNLMRENLRRSTEDDALLEIVDNGIAGTDMPGHGSLNTREIRNVAAYVRSLGVAPREDLPGDPAAGRELYDMTLCSTCHIVNGEGMAPGSGSLRCRFAARQRLPARIRHGSAEGREPSFPDGAHRGREQPHRHGRAGGRGHLHDSGH